MLQELHPLKKRIAAGEGSTLDFKSTISSARKIAKTLVAFANTKGGSLLIGVKDNGYITGIKSEEEFYMIDSAAGIYCKPEVHFEAIQHEFRDKIVLEIYVPQSKERPHYAMTEEGQWTPYIRVNDKSVIASKVTTEVIRRETAEIATLIKYTSKEQALLEYLANHEQINLEQYCKLLNLSRRRATRILINLVCAGVIRHHNSEKQEFYTLA
jgi:predicted HTH transcriptional regulator